MELAWLLSLRSESKPYAARTATEAGANGTSQNATGIIAADERVPALDTPLHSAAPGQMAQFIDASLGRLSKTAHFDSKKRNTHFEFAIAPVPALGGRFLLTR